MDPLFPRLLNLGSFKNMSEINETWIIKTSEGVDPSIVQKFIINKSINDPAYTILIIAYCLLILFGAAGNSLVVIAVARKPAMRTARNMFIVNLAISDLLLCLVTMPLTLVEILSNHWPLGRHVVVCKTMGILQATSIFVSTISITAIALDRYQVIVYPTRESLHVMGAIGILSAIWVCSLALASPMFIYRILVHHDVNLTSYGSNIDRIYYCLEQWPIEHGRAYYSAFSLFVQYLLPIVTVSVAYLRIYYKLRYRYATRGLSRETGRERGRRMQRTNSLLIAIAVIFCISWLPLNLFNLFADIFDQNEPPFLEREPMMVMYAMCHMMGMSSACSNPLLYGWLNDNFKKEFKEILCQKDASSTSSDSGRTNSRRRTAPEPTHIGSDKGDKLNKVTDRREAMMLTENGGNITVNDTELSVLR